MSEPVDRRDALKSALLDRLHEPLQLRIVVVAVTLLIGYVAVYLPLSDQIDTKNKQIAHYGKILGLAKHYELLKKQHDKFADRIPKQIDTKEWVQYMLEGTRKFPLGLTQLDCPEPKRFGPYGTVAIQMELDGSFLEMCKLLRWLETNKRLLRVDVARVAPARGRGTGLIFQVTVLGLAG